MIEESHSVKSTMYIPQNKKTTVADNVKSRPIEDCIQNSRYGREVDLYIIYLVVDDLRK